MSKFNAIKRILRLYPAIIHALTDLAFKKDIVAATLLLQMKTLKLVGHLFIITDIAFIVEPLNQTLQKRDLDFESIEATYRLTCLKLEDLIDQNKTGSLLQSFLNDVQPKGIYKKILLRSSKDDIEYLQKRNKDLIALPLQSLKFRLGEICDFIPFKVLNIDKIKKLRPNTPRLYRVWEI